MRTRSWAAGLAVLTLVLIVVNAPARLLGYILPDQGVTLSGYSGVGVSVAALLVYLAAIFIWVRLSGLCSQYRCCFYLHRCRLAAGGASSRFPVR
jgi:hypothetical protein